MRDQENTTTVLLELRITPNKRTHSANWFTGRECMSEMLDWDYWVGGHRW